VSIPNAPRDAPAENQRIAARIRTECIRRGWDLQEFAHRAGLSRTTVYNLERGHTSRPHTTTFGKVAAALDLPVDELFTAPASTSDFTLPDPPADDAPPCPFDVATNPAVTDVMRERPQLFAGWSRDDVDELYSLFGTGGQLNRRGVVSAAEAINRKREAIRKLHVVLETHLRERAIDLIDILYDLVRVPASGGREPAD
jgi:transcriptional regulator with XRE-family HTH domain